MRIFPLWTAVAAAAIPLSAAEVRLPDSGEGLLAWAAAPGLRGVPTAARFGLLFDGAPVSRAAPARPPRPIPVPLTNPGKMARQYRTHLRRMLGGKDSIHRFDSVILAEAQKRSLNPRLVKSVIAAESEFKTTARSRAGALGLMQLMPKTAEYMGIPRHRLFQAESNIRAGAAYLAHLFRIVFRRYGLTGSYAAAPRWAVNRVLAAYQAGTRYLKRRPLLKSTRQYLAKIAMYRSVSVSRIRLP